MEFDRRYLLKTALGGASLAFGAPAFAQVAAQPFPQWVETFRARALAKGISDATYTRVMGSLKPDTDVFTQIRYAGLRNPNSRITGSFREWIDMVCPRPP